MSKYFQYLFYLLKHKYYVYKGGQKYKVPLWILIFHDWDKFLPYMFYSFAARRFGKNYDAEKFMRAWKDHQNRSKHHFEHWIVANPNEFADGNFYYLDISGVHIREMLADWYGAGYAQHGKDEVVEWYEKHKEAIKISNNSRRLLERILYESEETRI